MRDQCSGGMWSLWLWPVLAGCAMLPVGVFPRTTIPAEIAAPGDQKLALVAAAAGVQIYRCDPKKDAPSASAWVFQAPEAILRDVAGRYIGKHYAGPTWEAEDGSKVVGAVDARRDAPESTAIPWLRLKTKSSGSAGTLTAVTSVLRLSTAGGQPPPGGCSEPDLGRIVRVEYSADYYFYVNR